MDNKKFNNDKEFPDSSTFDKLPDQLIFIKKVEEGIQQSKEGNVVSNEDIKSLVDKWSG